jgi:hypothetical protein
MELAYCTPFHNVNALRPSAQATQPTTTTTSLAPGVSLRLFLPHLLHQIALTSRHGTVRGLTFGCILRHMLVDTCYQGGGEKKEAKCARMPDPELRYGTEPRNGGGEFV